MSKKFIDIYGTHVEITFINDKDDYVNEIQNRIKSALTKEFKDQLHVVDFTTWSRRAERNPCKEF